MLPAPPVLRGEDRAALMLADRGFLELLGLFGLAWFFRETDRVPLVMARKTHATPIGQIEDEVRSAPLGLKVIPAQLPGFPRSGMAALLARGVRRQHHRLMPRPLDLLPLVVREVGEADRANEGGSRILAAFGAREIHADGGRFRRARLTRAEKFSAVSRVSGCV